MSQGFSISFGNEIGLSGFGDRPFRIELDSLDWVESSGSIVGMSLDIVGTPNFFTSVQSFGYGLQSLVGMARRKKVT